MEPLKLSLLENAESFVSESISKAITAERDPRQWTFAVLAAVQAIELTLKEILRRKKPTLIFRNSAKPKFTVSLEEAMERLTSCAQLEFSPSDVSTVKAAIALRNQVVHFEVSFEPNQVKAIVASLIHFTSHLFGGFLHKQLREAVDETLWLEATQMGEFATELWTIARARIASEMIPKNYVMDCRCCYGEGVLVANDQNDVARCYVCGNTEYWEWYQACGNAIDSDDALCVMESENLWVCQDCTTNHDAMDDMYLRLKAEFAKRRPANHS